MGGSKAAPARGRDQTSKHRQGFTVFINNVSKRIHYATLKEAFNIYGEVLDSYITYRSLARKRSQTTFAFIRFKTQAGAKRAIDKGDGRMMDGFKVRVYPEKTGKKN
ncbi:hypothetical protein HRI_003043400 [Hibiscus trionum]|uniref:RRM domain-containing protein n=1 Tax=Hibiscus trionum TaxID=183268 RepID=A0A9W7MAS0_HIBTR|nr:hypothetical protein HRI_003043400 [Hibiscus trionum]